MATSFSLVYPLIRSAVGDTDVSFPSYSDAQLKAIVNLTITILSNDSAYSKGGEESFSGDLTTRQIGIVALTAAKTIISGMPVQFSYKHPALQVSRTLSKAQTMQWLEDCLERLVSGSDSFIPMLSYSDLEFFVDLDTATFS